MIYRLRRWQSGYMGCSFPVQQKGNVKSMKGIFNLDSPLISFLSRLADLMILNVLTLICCIPIITIGASFTSMYYVLLRLHNDEINSVTKDFFHAFKINFKQATIMWAIYLLEIFVLVEDYYLMFVVGVQILMRMRYVVYIFTALFLIGFTWSFVLLSRYNNSIGRTILNSYFIAFAHFIRTILMVLLMLAALALILFFPAAALVMTLIGISMTGYLQTLLFSKVFKKLEQSQTENEEPKTDNSV